MVNFNTYQDIESRKLAGCFMDISCMEHPIFLAYTARSYLREKISQIRSVSSKFEFIYTPAV